MAVNDIIMKAPGAFGTIGTRRYLVNNSAGSINAGEPVVLASGWPYAYVIAMATSKPTIGTDYVVGVAQSAYTSSVSGGFVDVFPAVPGVQYFINPKTAATFGLGTTLSQAVYNGMIGYRVTIDLTTGSYTLNSTDGLSNGCIVEYTDVNKSGGRAAFSIRQGATVHGAVNSV